LFLHAVSHDLRNPVLGTAMVLDQLSTQSGDEITLPRRTLERMQDSNQRQLALINSLIDTHATEIWGITLQPRPLALKPIVDSAIADLLPILEKEQTHLDNRIPVDLPLVEVDPLQLARVYQNLLANALKHNPTGLKIILDARIADSQPGTPTETAKAGAAQTLNPGEQNGWIYCTVTDDGIGISPDQCQRLFDPYFRGESKSRSVGLGLGLYLCRQIIQAHGGEIGVSSQPRRGAMFWFTLPISHAPAGKALPSDHASANVISS
jgi:signal transduction histidine kinase